METKLNAKQQKIFNNYIGTEKDSYVIKKKCDTHDMDIYFSDFKLSEDNDVVLTIKCNNVIIKLWKRVKHILIIIL